MSEIPTIVAGPGLRVGEYVLEAKIGQGTFGEVWKAHHRAWTDQHAAVKIPTDPAYLRQLQSEGFSLHRLSHPNVVRVVGFDPTASPPYLMTELVDGPSLRALLARGRLTVPQAVAIIRQILSGLAYAHQQGAVHGDLKPENVLIEKAADQAGFTAPGSVKLTDFGVGLVSAAAVLGGSGSSRLLRSDRPGTVGTLAYIAPEQREGISPDAKSDLFSCGVIFFELLTGERPGGMEPPSELNPDVPTALDDVFRRAYARRDRRFGSAQDFLNALDTATNAAPPLRHPVPQPQPLPPLGRMPESKPQAAAPPPSPQREYDDDLIIGLRREDGDDGHNGEDEDAPPTAMDVPMKEDEAPIPALEPPAQAPPVSRTAAKEPVEPPAESASSPEPAAAAAPAAQATRPPHRPPMQRVVIVIDELARKPIRSADELRALFRQIYLTRELDEGEIGNLRLRLDSWAESIGGLPDFGQRIEITQAVESPYHRLIVTTHYEQNDGQVVQNEAAVMLANPAASRDCGPVLEAGDFSVVLHISTAAFLPHLLDMIGIPVIRAAALNLINAAGAQAAGRRIVRQELKLARSNVLSLKYAHETGEQGICFAGNTLQVVAATAPVTRMRDELLKRAAALLDTENIGAGINELRQMFLTPNPAQPRAEKMLVALRGKLSAAYMRLARVMVGNFGVFESLTCCHQADELVPGSMDAVKHEQRVRKLAFWIHFGPGLAIGIVFGLIAAVTRPFSYGYTAAAVGAALAGLVIWYMLRLRPARTDVAFCHACLVPLALAAILATGLTQLRPIPAGFFCVILGVSVLVADRLVFRNYGYWLLRPTYRQSLGGSPLDVLNSVQTMVEPDWEKLRPHYVALEPLYKHASVKLPGEEAAPQANQPDESDLE